MIPDFARSVGAPRVAAIEHPLARPLGMVGDADGQRAVLRAALAVLHGAAAAGDVVPLPFRWPEPPARARSHPATPPPIVELLKRKPWLALRLLAGDIPPRTTPRP
jgi:hypothetical protein